MLLKSNSKILKGSSSTTTRDSHRRVKGSSRLQDSRSCKDKNLHVSPRTPRGNSKNPNPTKSLSLRGSSSSRFHQDTRGLTRPSTSRRALLCLRPNTGAWR